jgi:Predicted nucleoside-diphosphate-sugar epimerases
MGRPLRARSPYPGHSAAHPLNQQGQCSVPQDQEKTHVFSNGNHGKSGGATAEHLLAHGKEVRALVRNREKASSWANQGVELVDGDWNDSAAIERALKGVEGAFVMLPAVWAPRPITKKPRA